MGPKTLPLIPLIKQIDADNPSNSEAAESAEGITEFMERKFFWMIFIGLSLVADFLLPLVWGLVATLPIAVLSWWIAYKSGWFE